MVLTVIFPIYIWFIFSFLHNKMPRIFTRIGVGIILTLCGVLSMFVADIIGHSKDTSSDAVNVTSHCMFNIHTMENTTLYYSTLNMHWSVLILPNVLVGIGPLLVDTTALEFISAQSPHSMKGLLVGVFFAIKGLLQFLGSIIIIPLSLKQTWGASIISCGFIYFFFICVVGLIGFVLFLVAAKKYKYRKRDDVTFCQRDVEEVYDRYITQEAAASLSYESVDD